jgi:ComF family protein
MQIQKIIKNTSRLLIELIFPIQCLDCGKEKTWLCEQCFKKLEPKISNHCAFCESKTLHGETCAKCKPEHALDGAIACIPYSDKLIQTLIHAWKYNSVEAVTKYLSLFTQQSLELAQNNARKSSSEILQKGIHRIQLSRTVAIPPVLLDEPLIVIPTPLHPNKLKERGFNQSNLLAQSLAQYNQHWELMDIIQRTKKTTAQASLHGIDRITNMQNAFALSIPTDEIRGKHIIIIDDVITTGSTTNTLALLLKRAYAKSVWSMTIAYGHPL